MRCDSYRGVNFISAIMKIVEIGEIIEKRIRSAIKHRLGESQSGFRIERSTQSNQWKKNGIAAFVDPEKACDIVRKIMSEILADSGIKEPLIRIIQSIYEYMNENSII